MGAAYADAGTPIRTVKYAGASHSFDATYAVAFLPKTTTALPFGVVRRDIEPWTAHSVQFFGTK